MGKDLEKCKLLKTAFDLKTANLDSLVAINIKLFNDLEEQQEMRLQLQKKLSQLNQEKEKYFKRKKRSWVVPAMCLIGGVVIGGNL